jgi:hypothetical protein
VFILQKILELKKAITTPVPPERALLLQPVCIIRAVA